MEKGEKRIQAVSGEIPLPEAMLQYIQSFLSWKEAAQTSILSKSWYGAWSTRPNLDLDQRDFQHRSDGISDDGFSEFARKRMQGYEELDLKIESLRLCMKWWERGSIPLANELIAKAMKIGATDLNFQLLDGIPIFVLPNEVLGSETLVRLSVNGCKIDLGVDGKVSCSRLKSLSFRRVYIVGDIIWDIISSFPLIEELTLSECTCYVKVQCSNFVSRRSRMLALNPSIEFGKRNVGSRVDGQTNLYEFGKLKCLLLDKVKIGACFFSDFSSKFPCLKDLTVCHCFGYKEIEVSSSSLECISFTHKRMLRANFDVPSIRRFNFSGSSLPSLSFVTASRKWESDISIMCSGNRTRLSSSWFLKFKKVLTELSPSKISLALNIRTVCENSSDYTGDIQGLPKPPVVENLALLMDAPTSVCSALLDGLFWSCHPKIITQYWLPKSCTGGNADCDFLELLCRTLIQEAGENCCIPNRGMSGLDDLEEVNVEFFEENLADW